MDPKWNDNVKTQLDPRFVYFKFRRQILKYVLGFLSNIIIPFQYWLYSYLSYEKTQSSH